MYFNVHFLFTDSLSAAIEAISVSTELVEEELKPYLDTVLNVAIERSKYFMVLLYNLRFRLFVWDWRSHRLKKVSEKKSKHITVNDTFEVSPDGTRLTKPDFQTCRHS